jgi:hypothetical protein
MTDRAILCHLLSHAEYQTRVIDGLQSELDSFRPILDMLRPAGAPPNAVSMAQTARAFRRARKNGTADG